VRVIIFLDVISDSDIRVKVESAEPPVMIMMPAPDSDSVEPASEVHAGNEPFIGLTQADGMYIDTFLPVTLRY
jgi:hypothetical protein